MYPHHPIIPNNEKLIMSNKSKSKMKMLHTYRGVRDNIVVDSRASTLQSTPFAANTTTGFTLSPLGIGGTSTGSSAVVTLVENPHMPWLYTTSKNFEMYRVLNARLVVVANSSTTTTGNFGVVSSPDYSDTGGVSVATVGTAYPMSGLANKDVRIPLRIDSSWKKVSYITNQVVYYSSSTYIVAVNSVNDITFGSVTITVNSTAGLGLVYIEYDIEFKNPINNLING